MWCPSCRAEYRPGFTRCPDCDLALQDTEPAPDAADLALLRGGPSLVTVFEGPPEESEAVKGLLDRRGVIAAVGPVDDASPEDSVEPVAVVVRDVEVGLALSIIESEDWDSLRVEPGDPIYDESIPIESEPDLATSGEDYMDADVEAGGTTDWPTSMDAAAQPSTIQEEVPWYSTPMGRFVLGVGVLAIALAIISRAMSS